MPDLSHTKTKIPTKFPLLSTLITTLFPHPTFTHTLLFLLIIYFIPTTYIPNHSLTTPLLLGMATHLILDPRTLNRIKFFFPPT
ncbi:metal-dependent hydrolase, partial [Bacillus altitudinis]|uniref:metal-dependent hydrolase n=1 Tax=Bacillus altitudinis TaxID=293387 RepID=UPI00235385C6